jgi:hypothetical protein
MSWLSSLVVGMLTGALGVGCAGLVANACVSWYRISSFEGKSGYFVVGMALLGGIAGFVAGVVTARIVAAGANPGFLKGLGISLAVVLAVAGTAAALARLLADVPPEIDGRQLELAVEFRLPAGEIDPPPAADDTYMSLGTSSGGTVRRSERGSLDLAAARHEDGRWIVPGRAFVFTGRGQRIVDLVVSGETRAGFIVPLPGRPDGRFAQWSQWLPQPGPGSPPWPESKVSYRFRVEEIMPPPPEPDPAEVEAAEFAALSATSRLAEWLRFVRYGQPEERIAAAMAAVDERQDELAQAIRAGGELREDALVAVVRLARVTPGVAAAVVEEGRAITDAVRAFNAMSEGDPEFHNVQVELRSRFSSWHRAWWTVHRRTGVDGRPPVQEILDLAQVRAAGTSMDEIVVNARAHLEGIPAATAGTP